MTGVTALLVWSMISAPQITRGAPQTPSIESVAATLRAGDMVARRKAIAELLSTAPNTWTPDVVKALISELYRLRAETDERHRSRTAGGHVEPVADHGLYLSQIIEAASKVNAPHLIEPLAQFIETGNMVKNAIARYGDRAVEPVYEIALADDRPERVSAALDTLTRIATANPARAVSAVSRGRMLQASESRLRGQQHVVVVRAASELGVQPADPALIRRVEALSADASALTLLGITDAELVAELQQKLGKLLARQRVVK